MAENSFLDIDRQILGDIYTSNATLDNLIVLCDEFGSRFGGTPGERQAAEYMRDLLKQYGLSDVRLEPIHYTGWRQDFEVTFEILEPVQRVLPAISLPHSPPASLEGPLIDLGDGDPEVFERRAAEIAGSIVMTNSVVNPGNVKRWVHRNEKYGRALLAGASGFIFANHYPGYGPATGGIGPDVPEGGEALIPGVSLSKEDAAYLQRLLRRHGTVRVRITSTDATEPMTSWNVVGDIPGTADNPEIIMFGCHYDGHDISQGAADPASGAVAVLEAARVLKAYAPPLPHTLRFALWGVEEIGLLGSTQYVQQHAAELDVYRFYLNMDMAGALEEKDIILNEWPALAPVFEHWSDEMALPYRVGQSIHAHSDHYPFFVAGVPTASMGSLMSGSSGGRGYGHTKFDTVDKVSLRHMREAAAMAARLALRLATAEPWPASRRAPEDVEAILLGDADYREETELSRRVHALYRAPSAAS